MLVSKLTEAIIASGIVKEIERLVKILGGDSQSGSIGVGGSPKFLRTSIVDTVTGKPVQVEKNGGLAVNIQDQHSKALDLNFIQSLGATTLGVDASPGDRTITLTDATGFVGGNVIGIVCPTGEFYFGEQVGTAAGNVITLDTPIDSEFANTACTVLRATKDLAVDGSGTTQVFQVGPVGGATGIELGIYLAKYGSLSLESFD